MVQQFVLPDRFPWEALVPFNHFGQTLWRDEGIGRGRGIMPSGRT